MSKSLVGAQCQRHILNRPHIHGHIFTNQSVAARHGPRQHTVFINQRTGQAIHLDITQKFFSDVPAHFFHALYPRRNFRPVKHVLQGNHPRLVLDLGKFTERFSCHSLGWAVWCDEFRKLLF